MLFQSRSCIKACVMTEVCIVINFEVTLVIWYGFYGFLNELLHFANFYTDVIFYNCLLMFKILCPYNIFIRRPTFMTATKKTVENRQKTIFRCFHMYSLTSPFEWLLQLTHVPNMKEIYWKIRPLWCKHMTLMFWTKPPNMFWGSGSVLISHSRAWEPPRESLK